MGSDRTLKLPAKVVGRLQRVARNAHGMLEEGVTDTFMLIVTGGGPPGVDQERVMRRFMDSENEPNRIPGLTLAESEFASNIFAIGLGACADAALKRLAAKYGPLDDYQHLLEDTPEVPS